MAAIFEEFANGEDFNASDFNTLVMRQAIIACDNQTDRDAILTPQEGLTVYRKDTKAIERYNGSSWDSFDTQWQSYTPTLTNLTLGNGTSVGKYLRQGKKISVEYVFTLGTTSAVGSNPEITLPFTRASGYGTNLLQPLDGTAFFVDEGNATYNGCVTSSTTQFRVYCIATGFSAGSLSPTSAANPFTFGSTDQLGARFSYIAA